MKNTIIFFLILSLTSCASQYGGLRYSERTIYDKKVSQIEPWRNGEKKKDFIARYNNEKQKIYQEVTHQFRHIGGHKYPNECSLCLDEINAIKIAEREAERKQREAEREAERKQREKEAREKNLEIKIDSLSGVFFTEKYIKEKLSNLPFDKKIKKIDDAFINYQKQRLYEVDLLEKKYIGRLEGEIFRNEKIKLNNKWEEKVSVLIERAKSEEKELIDAEKAIQNEYLYFLMNKLSVNERTLISKNKWRFSDELKPSNDLFEIIRIFKESYTYSIVKMQEW